MLLWVLLCFSTTLFYIYSTYSFSDMLYRYVLYVRSVRADVKLINDRLMFIWAVLI